jgi:hypothetical protein
VFVEGGLPEAIQRINQLVQPMPLQGPQNWEEAASLVQPSTQQRQDNTNLDDDFM